MWSVRVQRGDVLSSQPEGLDDAIWHVAGSIGFSNVEISDRRGALQTPQRWRLRAGAGARPHTRARDGAGAYTLRRRLRPVSRVVTFQKSNISFENVYFL